MSNVRETLETGMAGLLQSLVTSGKLRSVIAIGGMDYDVALKSVLGQSPFAIIKYTGKTSELTGGGYKRETAVISVLIGTTSFKSTDKRKQDIYELLSLIQNAMEGQTVATGFYPLEMIAEQWSQMTGGTLEVWEQQWSCQWELDFGKP